MDQWVLICAFLWCAASSEGSCGGCRWKGFNCNHCFLLLSTGKVAEGSRHMEDSSIIHYAPLSHFEMVTEIKHISV